MRFLVTVLSALVLQTWTQMHVEAQNEGNNQFSSNFNCSGEGFFNDPDHPCSEHYFACFTTGYDFMKFNLLCEEGTVYNSLTYNCDLSKEECLHQHTSSTETSKNSGVFECTSPGFFPVPGRSCSSDFLICIDMGNEFRYFETQCSDSGMIFNSKSKKCDMTLEECLLDNSMKETTIKNIATTTEIKETTDVADYSSVSIVSETHKSSTTDSSNVSESHENLTTDSPDESESSATSSSSNVSESHENLTTDSPDESESSSKVSESHEISSTDSAITSPMEFECSSSGQFANPNAICTQDYFVCINVNGKFISVPLICPKNMIFDPQISTCGLAGEVCSSETSIKPQSTTDSLLTTTWYHTRDDSEMSSPQSLPTFPSYKPFKCTKEGMFPLPSSCTKYYKCKKYFVWFYQTQEECTKGKQFDPQLRKCSKHFKCVAESDNQFTTGIYEFF